MKAETDDHVLRVPNGDGPFLHHATPRAHSCNLTGLRIVALPPGRIEVTLRDAPAFINVIPGVKANRLHRCIVDQSDIRSRSTARTGGGFDLFASGLDHEVTCDNFDWQLFIELDEAKLPRIAAEAWEGRMQIERQYFCRPDHVISHLARLTIDHLRDGPADRLYVEGLAIAVTARSFGQAHGRAVDVPTINENPRIARAIDYIEANLGADLSVAAIASAAAMSPSWFQSAFKAATGQPVFAYVRERRLKRARILLSDRRLSLSQIAYTCGFSSHSHMTRLFRAQFGAAPRDMR